MVNEKSLIVTEYSKLIELKIAGEINDLVYASNLGERFDFGDFLFTGYIGDKLAAIETLRLEELNEILLPRFMNIIFHPDIKRSKKIIYFLETVQKKISEKGYKAIWAYILNEKQDMIKLAQKFGFREYEKDDFGLTLYKEIRS